MRYYYCVHGTLFRNLGEGTAITAGDVTLRQFGEIKQGSFGQGWSFEACVETEASDDAEARKHCQYKVRTFLDSISLIGRFDDLENEALLKDDGSESFRKEGTPGSILLKMRMLYGDNVIEAKSLKALETRTAQVAAAMSSATPNISLASRWYGMSLVEENDTDRFMKLWVALDTLVPLGNPPREFDNFKGRALSYLATRYPGLSVKSLFCNLYDLRKRVFHEGDHAAVTRVDAEKTRMLIRNLILDELGLQSVAPLPNSFF